MYKIFLLILLAISITNCASIIPTNQSKKADQIIVTNSIIETKITGEGIINDPFKDFSISVKPIDTRAFDRTSNLDSFASGSHKAIISSVDKLVLIDDSKKIAKVNQLRSRLLEEGLSNSEINTITAAVFDKSEATNNLFVYTNPNIYLNDRYKVSDSNPFAFGNRYLTVVELSIKNNSNNFNTVCEDELFITSNNTLYNNIPTSELLQSIPIGSPRYEALYTLLLKNCEIIPANSTITTHLVFPFFYNNEKLTIHYKVGDDFIQKEFNVENRLISNEYIFSKMKVITVNKQGFRVVSGSGWAIDKGSNETGNIRYHFLKINDSVSFIDFENFFIHDEADLSAIEIITVRKLNNDVEIYRTPISKAAILRGSVSVIEE
jgi:hypothetical protein